MTQSAIIKIIAILSLLCIYVVDALTWKIDHTLIVFIVSVIAGLAGYEVGRNGKERRKSR